MVKIGIVSDLHSEKWNREDFEYISKIIQNTTKDADLILLAGDIGEGAEAIKVASKLFADKQVCLVAGNHEFYGKNVNDVLYEMEQAAANTPNVIFLNRNTYYTYDVFDKPVRVLGATLWTDFALYGNPHLSMAQAALREYSYVEFTTRYPDFYNIKVDNKTITPEEMLKWHERDREWILKKLDIPFDGKTIMMTHHVPVSFGIRSIFKNSPITPCFASAMENLLIRDDLDLVTFGHTHYSLDRTINKTRFLSNQVGYLGRTLDRSAYTETGDFGITISL